MIRDCLRILAISVLFGAPAAALAAEFRAINGGRVLQVDQVLFEVVPRTRDSNDFFWCGAADFARRALGADWSDRIYIARGRGVSVTTGRRTAVQFTLNPQAAGVTPLPPGGLRVGLQPGDNMRIQQAYGFCGRVLFVP